jgi:Ca2+-binding EF-hand superfamily protein
MDLLQLLNRDDLENLAGSFGKGLNEAAFVGVMMGLIQSKYESNPSEYLGAMRRWKSKALKELFQAIDYNQDGTLQYEELTNFAINSALNHTANQNQRVELQFRDYQLVQLRMEEPL